MKPSVVNRPRSGPGTGRRVRRAVLPLGVLACLALAGCAQPSMDDLNRYVEEVLARESRQIDPLPEIAPYRVHTYQMSDAKDPFEPFFDETPEQVAETSTSGIRPPSNHVPEELEAFALDSLRMVGTLEMQDGIWGVVRASDGTVHRVQVNNYMGRNYGRIINIQEERIDLIEIIPDGAGGWMEREASLALVE